MGDLLRFDPIARRLGMEPARHRLDELLERHDAATQIQALEPLYLFGLIREVGVEDALPALHHTSGEQAQALVDFDCWDGDRPDLTRLGGWLAAHFQGPLAHIESVRRGLDPELLGLFFKSNLQVYFYEDEDDAEVIDYLDADIESSPDGVFALVMPEDPNEADLLRQLLKRLYAADSNAARELLLHARWELTSTLEETAFQMRQGRLEQHGFLPLVEALEIYAPIVPARERARAEAVVASEAEPLTLRAQAGFHVPIVLTAPLLRVTDEAGGSFLGHALRRVADRPGDPGQADRLLLELTTLVNRVLVAERGRPGDPEDSRAALQRAHGYLNVGLEYLTRRDAPSAARLIERWPLKRVLRTGFSLVASLAAQAHALIERGELTLLEELSYSLCKPDESELLEALMQPRPERDADQGVPFGTLAEIEHAAHALTLLAYKAAWTFGLSGLARDALAELLVDESAGVPAEDVTFDALLATRAAAIALGDAPGLRLLSLAEVAELVAHHILGDELSPRLADALVSVAHPPQPGAGISGSMADRWITDVTVALLENYGQLRRDALAEPRFLPALLLWRRDG